MKKIFSLLPLTFYALTTCGQNVDFTLKGYLNGMETGKIKLVYDANTKGVNIDDSTKVVNGQFLINGKLPHGFPYLTLLWLNDSLVTKLFFISPGYQEIRLDIKHFSIVPQMATAASSENDEYNVSARPADSLTDLFFIHRNHLYAIYNNHLPSRIADSLQKALNNISDLKDQVIKSFLEKNPKSYVGLWHLFDRVLLMGYRPGLSEAYQEVDDSLKSSIIGKKVESVLSHSKMIQKGAVFPRFMVQSMSGDSVLFRINKQDKITLVDFWYSHCSPCIAQFETLKKLYNEYHPLGFNIVG
ncbi:MAG TPA: DUF4369 domain-containing protein, partial [Candidatus Babeliaceae bacterium]|nr:DUF4369 domain-containing protein [Candidatus Babeliaceae bacterium]